MSGRYRMTKRWTIALRYSELPVGARALAFALSTWMDADGIGAPASLRDLAAGSGLDKATVCRQLERLEASGWIRRRRGGGRGRASAYDARIPEAVDRLVEDVLNGRTGATLPSPKLSRSRPETVAIPGRNCRTAVPGDADIALKPCKPSSADPDGADDVRAEPPWRAEGKSWDEWLYERRSREAAAELVAHVQVELERIGERERSSREASA